MLYLCAPSDSGLFFRSSYDHGDDNKHKQPQACIKADITTKPFQESS